MVSPDNKLEVKEDSCLEEKLPLSRGSLPWQMRPAANSPEEAPLSGDRGEEQSRIGNFDLLTLPVDTIQLAMNAGQSVQRVEAEELSPAELHQLYAGTQVPEHRYLAPSLTMAVHSPEIAPHPAKWIAGIPEIDLAKVANAWLNTNGNTDYEQLYCIGLDRDTGQLSGVLKVKQGSGYSGGPRTAGSIEYVAFWVDWGSGFQYEGTAEVAVYDFGWLPPAGLGVHRLPAGRSSFPPAALLRERKDIEGAGGALLEYTAFDCETQTLRLYGATGWRAGSRFRPARRLARANRLLASPQRRHGDRPDRHRWADRRYGGVSQSTPGR